MASSFGDFERIVREAARFTEATGAQTGSTHPFETRNLHPDLPPDARSLFDNGHFAQATFEGFKFVDEEMQRISNRPEFGKKLMMQVLGGDTPLIKLNPGMTETEKSEQEGYKFLFAGATLAIRNPRGHKTRLVDDPDTCLDHLSLASMLLRRLDEAGLR